MAISKTFTGNVFSFVGNPPTSPQTFSLTVSSGSQRLLALGFTMRGGGGGVITGVTFNGIDMSAVTTEASAGSTHSIIYYLINPPVGTFTVSISHNFTGGGTVVVSVLDATGVDQINPVNAFNKAGATSAGPMTTSVVTTVPDCLIFDACTMRTGSSDTASMTAMTNRVEEYNALYAAGNSFRNLLSTVLPAASAGTYAMEWTKSYNHDWAIMAVAFAPSTAHAFTINNFSTGSPDNVQPTLGGKHVLTIQAYSTTSPTFGPVTLGQRHGLTIPAFSTGIPSLGPPGFAQRHSFTAPSFATASPDIGSPNLGSSGTTNFTIPAVEIGSPSYAPVSWVQRHVLQINAPSQSAPVVGNVLFSQRHALACSDFSVGAPDLGTPALAFPDLSGTLNRKNILADDLEERVLEDEEQRYLSDDVEIRILHHEESLPA